MIYFLQTRKPPYLIKIGHTTDQDTLVTRIKSLEYINKIDLILLKSFAGDNLDEVNLHFQFESERVKGEWFLPSKHLLLFLSKIMEPEKRKLLKKNSKVVEEIIDNIYLESRKLRLENQGLKKDLLFLIKDNSDLRTELRKYESETKDILLMNKNKEATYGLQRS